MNRPFRSQYLRTLLCTKGLTVMKRRSETPSGCKMTGGMNITEIWQWSRIWGASPLMWCQTISAYQRWIPPLLAALSLVQRYSLMHTLVSFFTSCVCIGCVQTKGCVVSKLPLYFMFITQMFFMSWPHMWTTNTCFLLRSLVLYLRYF